MADHKLQIVLAAKDITGKALTKFRGRIKAITKSVFSFKGALGSLAGASGIGLLVTRSLEAADAIGKTATAVGLTTDALQEYQHVATLAGVDTNQLNSSLLAFAKRVGKLRQGTGPLVTHLKKFDEELLNNIQSAGSTEKALDLIFQRMGQMSSATDRAALASAAFSRAGIKMTGMVKNGADEMYRTRAEAHQLSLVIGGELIAASEKANDELYVIGKQFKTAFSTVVLENVDSLVAGIKALAEAANLAATAFGKMDRFLNTTIGGQLDTSVKEHHLKTMETQAADLQRRMSLVQRSFHKAEADELLKPMLQQYDLLIRKIKLVKGELIDKALSDFFSDVDRPAAGGRSRPGGRSAPQPVKSYDLPPEYSWFLESGGGALANIKTEQAQTMEAMTAASKDSYQSMTAHVQAYYDHTAEAYRSIDNRIETTFSHASDAITTFATTAKLNFTDFTNSLISDLIRMQSRMALTDIFKMAVGAFSGVYSSSGFEQPGGIVNIGGIGTKKLQHGGYLGEGVVGIGKRSGSSYEFHPNEFVVPANKMGGGGDVVINNYSGLPATQRRTDINGRRTLMVDIGNDILSGGPAGQAIGRRFGWSPVGKLT